ncbi:hypothetical protein K435DRAFT_688159, partial [Dendrothele bispora CBS 962.96]
DLKMVIEFPAGTSMLIPSGYCRHGNTAVVGGCRYSFTQYSAGGLFRYRDDEMRTRSSMSDDEGKRRKREAKDKVLEGLKLYSTLDEIFGSVVN